MKYIKLLIFVSTILLTLIGSNCFVVSNFDTSDDDDDDIKRSGLTIGIVNGAIISKHAMQSITQTLALADLASESLRYSNDVTLSEPVSFACDTVAGEIIAVTYDLDYSNTLSNGDETLIEYKNCSLNNQVINGSLKIVYLYINDPSACSFSSGLNWQVIFHVSTEELRFKSENEAYHVTGEIDIKLKYSVSQASFESIISNSNLAIHSGNISEVTESQITQIISLGVAPASRVLSINSHKIYFPEQNGFVDIEAKNLTGADEYISYGCFNSTLSPVSGIVDIIGNESAAKVQIIAGEQVDIDIDSNGDGISDETILSTISELF